MAASVPCFSTALAICALAFSVTTAQAAAPGVPANLPAFEGIWENLSGIHIDRLSTGGVNPLSTGTSDSTVARHFRPVAAPYNAVYAAEYEKVRASAARGQPINDPTARCIWPGVPRVIWSPYPVEIILSEGGKRVTFVHEYMSQVRRAYLDGREHPSDLEPSYNGHTIGHWEGQTLVLDTVGLREDTMFTNLGQMHSDALRVQERWRLIDEDLLEAQITMTDPKVFTAPWVTYRLYRRQPTWDIMDYVCEENNREVIVDGVTRNVSAER